MLIENQELFKDIYELTDTNEYYESTVWNELEPKYYFDYNNIDELVNLRRRVLVEMTKRLAYIVKKKLNLTLFEVKLCFQGDFNRPFYSSSNYDNDFTMIKNNNSNDDSNVKIDLGSLGAYLIPFNTAMPGLFKCSLAIIEVLDHISGQFTRFVAPNYNIRYCNKLVTLMERPKQISNSNNLEDVCIEYNYYNHMHDKNIPLLTPMMRYSTSTGHRVDFY